MVREIGERVKIFYNHSSFPDYDLNKFKNKEQFKLSMWEFSRVLDNSIPEEASIIDVGTGTGQLSAFLSLRRKKVVGVDFSDSSLNKAKSLKEKLSLNLILRKIDLLDDKQIDDLIKEFGKFDYVLCLGVLHHTGDARKGFKNICKLLKPQGKIAVGLYNKYGRILLKIRILLAKTIFKNNQKVKDYFIKLQIKDIQDKERTRGWWNDQYFHPYETSHTIREVLSWFNENNIKYIETQPRLRLKNESPLYISGVWNDVQESYPNILLRFINQLKWIITTHREGGYWITFGMLKE